MNKFITTARQVFSGHKFKNTTHIILNLQAGVVFANDSFFIRQVIRDPNNFKSAMLTARI